MNSTSLNTDNEIWREPHRGAYGAKIHVTAGGGIAIDVGGHVIVAPVKVWHDAGNKIICVNPKLPSWRKKLAYKLLAWKP